MRIQNLEKLLLRNENGKSWEVEADGLLIYLPLRNLGFGRDEEIAFRVHFAEGLLEINAHKVKVVINVFSVVDKGVLNHVDQILFDLVKKT